MRYTSAIATLPTVKLEDFEGPFDLLLELARKKKLDISRISLRVITDDFLAYIQKQSIPASTQGDFLIVASTLLLLKVRRLLPLLELEEKEIAEVEELEQRVRTYSLFREQARHMQKYWGALRLFPARFWADEHNTRGNKELMPVLPSDLSAVMLSIIARIPPAPHPRAHLRTRGRSLEECLAFFGQRLQRVKKLIFQEAVQGIGKQETAVSFLAVLEMAKAGQADLRQEGIFQSLEVRHRKV